MTCTTLVFDVPSSFFPRYLIPSLDRANAGHYRCIVRNRVGAIMQCSTEVQVACELKLCAPHENGWIFFFCITSSLPLFLCPFFSNLSILSSPLFAGPHIRRSTPSHPPPPIPHQYFILPLSSPALHLVLSLRQIWAGSWRPSDRRRCRRARALWCTRRGYTASPGRRSLGSETAARFPPAAACECASCSPFAEVTCWSELNLPGKIYFIFQCISFFL